MRLASLNISGFRAFPSDYYFDLDADAVILSGSNGTGKTSLLDAVLWALTGSLGRFGKKSAQIVSLYAPSGTARVSLRIKGSTDANVVEVTRQFDGNKATFLVSTGGKRAEGLEAERLLLEHLWPEGLIAPDVSTTLHTALTRSVYLQQDLVRQFLESDSDDARFNVVGELVGAGRITEFQQELESSRNAWSRGGGELDRRVESLREEVDRLHSRVNSLAPLDSASSIETTKNRWFSWWSEACKVAALGDAPPFYPSRAMTTLTAALQGLQAERRSLQRQIEDALALAAEFRDVPENLSAVTARRDSLKVKVDGLTLDVSKARDSLRQSEAAAAAQREAWLRMKELNDDLAALATVALRHLGDKCPVCQQSYDREATLAHLHLLTREATTVSKSVGPPTPPSDLSRQLSEAEAALTSAATELRDLQALIGRHERWLESLPPRLQQLGLVNASGVDDLEQLVGVYTTNINLIGDLYRRGEALSLQLARVSEQDQRSELTKALAGAESSFAAAELEASEHQRTGRTATTILEATRDAVGDVVEEQIRQIEPIVERIYARIDPHRAFKEVILSSRYKGGRGRLSALVRDPLAPFGEQDPHPVFSSSQLNALAVALFLGLNLGVPSIPLKAALLDDPLQSLDDVNLLGLLDTLRRTKETRQLLVSTHDDQLARLMEIKLRPVGNHGRTIRIHFQEWSHSGPRIEVSEIPTVAEELKVVIAA